MSPIRVTAVAAASVLAVLAVAPTAGAVGPQRAQQQPRGGLAQVGSCDELRSWLKDEVVPRISVQGIPGAPRGGPIPMVAMAPEAAAGAAPGAPVPQHSETNVQVEGVDEPDIVKTDGKRIVAVAGTKLHLASADGAKLLDSIDLGEQQHDSELLMAGNRVLVLSRTWEPGGVSQTRATQLDIANDALKVSGRYSMDGSYVSARMSGGDIVRLVVESNPEQRLPFVAPMGESEEAAANAQEVNKAVVDRAEPEDFLPRWQKLNQGDKVVAESPMMPCEQTHVPDKFSGFGMLAVTTIDLSRGLESLSPANGVGVMAGGQTVYSSLEHLYVAAPEWVDQPSPRPQSPEVAPKRQGTDIHRFDITDASRVRYEMSGHVDGTVLNQFSMDEHGGNLRVATTTGTQWGEGQAQSESHVVVLAPSGGELKQVGGVSGLGRGETIRSVRFIGDVGYVVTFRQTDPLYTIDLSDPTAPRVAGELKILGYSAYLHPIDEGHLIGVGQDATEEGQRLGTQIALFDVSDPAAPTRIAQAALANSTTPIEWDHHAFMWWPDTALAAIPVNAREDDSFRGLIGYTADVNGAAIRELGRVSHPTTAAVEQPLQVPQVSRSLVIGNRLWTLSDAGLAHSDLATLTGTQFLPFA